MQADGDDVTETGDDGTPETEPISTEGPGGAGAELHSRVEQSRCEADLRRRAFIQAGWTVPAVLAVGLTRDAKAQAGYYGGTPPPPPPD